MFLDQFFDLRKKGYAFLAAYLALTKKYYGVSTTSVDYGDAKAARQTINAWVEEKTKAKIKDLIPRGLLNALTRLVLVNAIYFKGNWASQFDPNLTKDAPFWVTPHKEVTAPMMTLEMPMRKIIIPIATTNQNVSLKRWAM